MPARRLPKAVAIATGAILKNPKRFRDRNGPAVGLRQPLGQPTAFLTGHQLEAWEAFRRELPWLEESDRSIVEIASVVRGRLMSGVEVGVPTLNQLRLCLAQLGASPTDRSKVSAPAEKSADPSEAFFNA